MILPYNMRLSTLDERKEFYNEFDIEKANKWVGRDILYAIILGKNSNIYLKQYENMKNIVLNIKKYQTLEQVKQTILEYLPEGIYYDRNYYKDISKCYDHDLKKVWDWNNFDGQELAFDIDPENVHCPVHGSLQQRMRRGVGLSFCKKAFEICKEHTIKLAELLSEEYWDIKIVFSGRGFHIHIFDESAIKLKKKERKKIANAYKNFSIDTWVTTGEMRFIRLPYTLNAISSRVVIPLDCHEIDRFDPSKHAIPFVMKD